MNIIDILLLLVVIISLASIIIPVWRKFPQLTHINVTTIPEAKQSLIKRQILEEKLKRDFLKRWHHVRSLMSGPGGSVSKVMGNLYTKLKDAEQELRIARKKDLSSQISIADTIETSIAAAREHFEDENYQRAEQILLECLKIDELNVKVYTLLAQIYRAQGDMNLARKTLEYVLTLTNNSDAGVYSSLATISLQRGDISTAQEEYLKSISLDPENYKYHLELADVYRAMEAYDKAQEEAIKALTLGPNNPKTLDFLIENSILLHNASKAQEYLTKLIEANPQNGKIPSFRERIKELKKRS